ncbi:MAG: TrmH family RNA methyltransferase [Micrococcales bacterium]
MTVNPEANPSPEQTTWGVGPWAGEWPTDEAGNLDPVLDPELLQNGDTRNVLDKYRYWRMEAIVADLDTKRHPYHVAIENWQHDLNIGSIVRTANAFLAAEVHIIGNKRWNRRGAMVTDRYQHVSHHPTVEDFVAWAATAGENGAPLPIVAIDNVPGCQQIERYELPESCVLLFGQEGPGLSDAAIAAAEVVLEITQFGSTRSINASAAAAIAMHSWVNQHVFSKG